MKTKQNLAEVLERLKAKTSSKVSKETPSALETPQALPPPLPEYDVSTKIGQSLQNLKDWYKAKPFCRVRYFRDMLVELEFNMGRASLQRPLVKDDFLLLDEVLDGYEKRHEAALGPIEGDDICGQCDCYYSCYSTGLFLPYALFRISSDWKYDDFTAENFYYDVEAAVESMRYRYDVAQKDGDARRNGQFEDGQVQNLDNHEPM